MPSIEKNSEDWREIRSRVDSIANIVFLISGGALSLSISVLLTREDTGLVNSTVACSAITSWYFLLGSIFFFLLLKVHLIGQAHFLQFKPIFVNNHLRLLNGIGWAFGVAGLITFFIGMVVMVHTAAVAIHG